MKSDAFKAAAASKDFSAFDELFAEEPVFRSPAVFKPYEGRDAMRAVLGAVTQVFEDFRYTGQVEDGDTAVLIFEARVGDRELNGVDILTFDEDGRISELMVMIRPLRGLEAVLQAMGEKLAEMGVPPPGSAA
jgi:SnoaL-like protein